MKHGNPNRYDKGCRCQPCVTAKSEHRANQDAKRRSQGLTDDDPRHGTLTGYHVWFCRCQPCKDASAQEQRERRARRAADHSCSRRHCQICIQKRFRADPHGTYHAWQKGCRCVRCADANDRFNTKRRRTYAATRAEFGSVHDLVADILETYHWESWTAKRVAMEAARIRGVRLTPRLIGTVRSSAQRLVRSGHAVKGREHQVRYGADGRGRMYDVVTVRWKDDEDARNTA